MNPNAPRDLSGAPEPSKLEKQRFMAMQMMRLMGAVLAILGVLIAGGKVDLPVLIGYVFVAIGLVDFFVMPKILARRWKSPNP